MEFNFDNAAMCLFIILCVGGAILAFIYYSDQLEEAQDKIADLECRNKQLTGAIARVLHHFDENDVCSHHNIFHKTRALSDARIVLTGAPKVEVKEDQ